MPISKHLFSDLYLLTQKWNIFWKGFGFIDLMRQYITFYFEIMLISSLKNSKQLNRINYHLVLAKNTENKFQSKLTDK